LQTIIKALLLTLLFSVVTYLNQTY